MKAGSEMPKDLDPVGRTKWKELTGTCDPGVDPELLANYCRQHSTLMAIREERARQQKAGTFKTMTQGRDSTEVLNPLLVHEGRLVAALNKMLKLLGLTPSTDERGTNRKSEPNPPPPGMTGPEPPYGWALELALCKGRLGDERELSPDEAEVDRRRKVNEALLAQGDWRKYETDHDKGRPLRRKTEPNGTEEMRQLAPIARKVD